MCVRRESAPLPIYILDIYIQYIYIFLIYIYLYIFLNPNSITKYRFLLDRQNEKTVQCMYVCIYIHISCIWFSPIGSPTHTHTSGPVYLQPFSPAAAPAYGGGQAAGGQVRGGVSPKSEFYTKYRVLSLVFQYRMC